MSLASDAGIDTTVCEMCEEPLDDARAWKRGLDGCGAHLDCLDSYLGPDGERVDCPDCGGEGFVNRHEEDPLWYGEDEWFRCETCEGKGGWVEPWGSQSAQLIRDGGGLSRSGNDERSRARSGNPNPDPKSDAVVEGAK